MSEPTVQDLVESVDALGKTTSELVERYTEAIFGVEASAGSAAEDAKKTAADRVQTGLDAEFTALKANEAKDSAAQAEQAKLDAQEVTQLSTFKQYRDQAQQGATTSIAQAVIATQKGTLATEQAAIATNNANVATEEATKSTTQAGIATQKAQAASDSERVVLQKAQEVSDNTMLVATHTATVVRKSDEVVVNASMVAEDKAVVVQKASEVASHAVTVANQTASVNQAASEVASNASSASNSALLSQEWAVGRTPPSSHAAPSNTNNAMYWAQQAQYNANQTFISGGLFTPSVSAPYPSIEGVVRDTIWIIEFPSEDATFTYTSGQLSGRMVKNGDLLFWDTPENEFNLIPTKIGGILSLVTEWGTETGPSVDIRGRYLRKIGDTAAGTLGATGFKVSAGGQGLFSADEKNIARPALDNSAMELGDVDALLRLYSLNGIECRKAGTAEVGRVFTSFDKPTAQELSVVSEEKAQSSLVSKYVLDLGTGIDALPRFGKVVSIPKTDASATLLIAGGGDMGVASRATVLAYIGSRSGQAQVKAMLLTQTLDPLGFHLYYKDTGTRFELWVSSGDANLPLQVTALSQQSAEGGTLVDWQPLAVGSELPDHLVDVTLAVPYTQINKPSPVAIGAVAGSSKAAFIAAGTTEDRPNEGEFPDNTRAIRFNTSTGEWEGLDPSGNITPIGGGGVPPFIEKTASFAVEKKKAYKINMADGVNKTITVNDGMANDDWFVISTLEWDRTLVGLTATVQFGTEVLTNGQDDFDGYVIDRPCVLYFLKSGGKWTLADGIGVDGSYNALEKRVDELEEYPTPWQAVGNTDNPDAVRWTLPQYISCNSGETHWRWRDEKTIEINGIARVYTQLNGTNHWVMKLPDVCRAPHSMTKYLLWNCLRIDALTYGEFVAGTNEIRLYFREAPLARDVWFMFNWTIPVERV